MRTATNPQTGEKLALINGQWVPVEATATNPETGQKIAKVNGKWGAGEDSPGFDALGAGYKFLKGAEDLVQNAATGMAKMGASDERRAEIDQYMAGREQNIEKVGGNASDLWRMGGNLVGGGITGGPTGTTGKLGRDALERVANVATESGLFGAMTGNDAAEDAAIGAGIAAPIEGASALLGKARQVPGMISRLLPMSDEARKADDFAKARNVPIAGEDLIQNNVVRSTGRILDASDPTNFRNKQLSRMEEAFKSELVDPFIKFDEPMTEMGESFKRRYADVNATKDKLYNVAFKELNQYGNVPMDGFRNDLLGLVDEYSRKMGPDSKEARTIQKWFDYEDVNIEDWADRRKILGRTIRKAERSADPDTVDLGALKRIRSSLDAAIDEFGGQSNSYRQANKYFREEVVPYREQALKKNIAGGDIEKVINDALTGSPSGQTQKRFQEVWSALDDGGRDAYRQSLLEQIMDAAKNPETGFSPDRAATMMDRLKNRLGEEVIGPELSQAMDGWNNLFRQSGFAAEQVARSRTGSSVSQVAGPAIALGTATGAPALLLPYIPAAMIRSRKVREMLAKVSKMDQRHPDYRTIVEEIMSEVSRQTARGQAVSD